MRNLFVFCFISLAGELGEYEAFFESGDDEDFSSVAGTTTSGLFSRLLKQEYFSYGVNDSLSERETLVLGWRQCLIITHVFVRE